MPSITCWRQGVAPTSWPAFRSCRLSPATAAALQVTAPIMIAATGPDRGARAHDCEQHERGEQDGRDRDAGDRVVRGTDEARHVAAHRGEHEAGDHHDHGHRERDAEVVDDRVVEREQRQHEEHDADQDRLHRQVALGMRDVRRRAGLQCHAGPDAGQQGLPQRPERPEPADQHRADADVADLRASRSGLRRPRRTSPTSCAASSGFWSIMKLL